MITLMSWMFALTISVCAIVFAAAWSEPGIHMGLCALIALVFIVMAIIENNRLRAAGVSKSEIASSTARYCGLVWSWGALAIAVTYGALLEARWPEWWQFFAGFGAAAIASLWFSNLLARDAAAGKVDEAMLKMGRTLTIVQVVGVIAALVTMFIEGKFPRAVTYADWAGCNIFVFGGLAIIAISLNALRTSR